MNLSKVLIVWMDLTVALARKLPRQTRSVQPGTFVPLVSKHPVQLGLFLTQLVLTANLTVSHAQRDTTVTA